MSETNEPFAEVVIAGETVPVTRDNLTLYRYLGANAVYDHCYVDRPDNKPGGYIWVHYDHFERFAKLAEEHQSELYLNITTTSEFDATNYFTDSTKDLRQTETIPEDWITEGIE
jgi:hypothetical protein